MAKAPKKTAAKNRFVQNLSSSPKNKKRSLFSLDAARHRRDRGRSPFLVVLLVVPAATPTSPSTFACGLGCGLGGLGGGGLCRVGDVVDGGPPPLSPRAARGEADKVLLGVGGHLGGRAGGDAAVVVLISESF